MPPLRIVAPLVVAFVLFLGIAANSVRLPAARPVRATQRASLGAFALALLRTVAAGYAVFLAIVLVFHVLLAGERAAIANALKKGSLLAFFVVVPAFVALSWAERAFAHRRDGQG